MAFLSCAIAIQRMAPESESMYLGKLTFVRVRLYVSSAYVYIRAIPCTRSCSQQTIWDVGICPAVQTKFPPSTFRQLGIVPVCQAYSIDEGWWYLVQSDTEGDGNHLGSLGKADLPGRPLK